MYRNFFKRTKKTVKLKGRGGKGAKLHTIRQTFKQSLCTGLNMKTAVQLPPGQDADDWIAMNTIELYNTLNLVHDFISEYCTATSCPEMSAGDSHIYYWMDGKEFRKPTKCSAAEYVTYLKRWINAQFEDPNIFPQGEGDPFSRKFHSAIRKILARMFRVYAHIYYNHYDKIKELQAEAHLYTCFKHYYYFVSEFQLVDVKEMVPLQSLIDKITASDAAQYGADDTAATAASSSSRKGGSKKKKPRSRPRHDGSGSSSSGRRSKSSSSSTGGSGDRSSGSSNSSSSSSKKRSHAKKKGNNGPLRREQKV